MNVPVTVEVRVPGVLAGALDAKRDPLLAGAAVAAPAAVAALIDSPVARAREATAAGKIRGTFIFCASPLVGSGRVAANLDASG